MDWGYKPFKVFNAWLDREGFSSIILDHWDKMTGSTLHLHGKLKSLRGPIKEWYCANEKPSEAIARLEARRNALLGKLEREEELHEMEDQLCELYKEHEHILRQKAKLNLELH